MQVLPCWDDSFTWIQLERLSTSGTVTSAKDDIIVGHRRHDIVCRDSDCRTKCGIPQGLHLLKPSNLTGNAIDGVDNINA
jgi:hypothetical protein